MTEQSATPAPKHLKRFCSRSYCVFLLLGCSAFFPASLIADCRDDPIAASLVSNDWAEVIRATQEPIFQGAAATHALVLAHVYTTLNRNNEALALYTAWQTDADLVAWETLTKCLATQLPQNAVVLFLAGDATARRGHAAEAIDLFTRSHEHNPRFALPLVARGAVHLSAGDTDQALIDFTNATAIAPGFAEAWASLGIYWVRAQLAEYAQRALSKALALNPRFGVAYLARAAVEYANGDFEASVHDLIESRRLAASLSSTVAGNLSMFAQSHSDLIPDGELVSPPGYSAAASARVSAGQTRFVFAPPGMPPMSRDLGLYAGGLRPEAPNFGPAMQTLGHLFDADYAKQWYAHKAAGAIASANGSGFGAGVEATMWDVVGGYIPGKPGNQGQAVAQVMWSVATMKAPSFSSLSTGVSFVINSAEGNPKAAALDALSLGGKAMSWQATQLFTTGRLPAGTSSTQLELSFMDPAVTRAAGALAAGGRFIGVVDGINLTVQAQQALFGSAVTRPNLLTNSLAEMKFSGGMPHEWLPLQNPGGVSLREFAHAPVDRGDWPLMTVQSLNYAKPDR